MTTTDAALDLSWVPPACSLPTAAQPFRVAELDELFRSTVEHIIRTDPTSLRLTLRPEPAVASTAADLAARESHCCRFFAFTLTIAPLAVDLVVEVPADHVEVLDALELRARAAR